MAHTWSSISRNKFITDKQLIMGKHFLASKS